MLRRCAECHKSFSGSVVEHYQKNHFGTYLKNGEDKIRKYPNMFAPECGTAAAREIKVTEAKQKTEKKVQQADRELQHDPEYRKRVRMITAHINNGCDEQTYRGRESFVCDMCNSRKSSGKRLLSYTICSYNKPKATCYFQCCL